MKNGFLCEWPLDDVNIFGREQKPRFLTRVSTFRKRKKEQRRRRIFRQFSLKKERTKKLADSPLLKKALILVNIQFNPVWQVEHAIRNFLYCEAFVIWYRGNAQGKSNLYSNNKKIIYLNIILIPTLQNALKKHKTTFLAPERVRTTV